MISRYEVWLNGEMLNNIDQRLYVSDVNYAPVALKYDSEPKGKYNGSYALNRHIESNEVTINFELRVYSTPERQEILQRVIRWAADGGWLMVNDRPYQRMYVKCTRLPVIASVMRWLDTLSITFTAFAYPYWENILSNKATIGMNVDGVLLNDGIEDATVEATITITAGTSVYAIWLKCGDTTMTLNQLSLSPGDIVTICYTEDQHILEIKCGDTSLLDKRTLSSSDDLIAHAGNNVIRFVPSGQGQIEASCEFSVKGVWL